MESLGMVHAKAKHKSPRQPHSAAPPAGYVLEDQIGYVLRCAHQRATEIFNAVMGGFGVTPTQFAALAKLDDLQAVSQNQLGRLTAMDPATISGVVGRLIARGLIRQSPNPRYARHILLTLTPLGKTAIAEMKAVAGDVTRRTLQPLTPNQAREFCSALAKVAATTKGR
jgi:MarR family transcriptional regulator, lower aerobic nicotinate degradation pathway regulator